jgi:hypothetical protein
VEAFYRIADLLTKDASPSRTEWSAMLSTPGYRLVAIDNPGFAPKMELALKPSRRAERDRILKGESDTARVIRHVIQAVEQKARVLATCETLRRTIGDSVKAAAPRTARFLPPGTMERYGTPFIGFAIFKDDGFAEDPGILLDPLLVADHGMVSLLAHEYHHWYTDTADYTMKWPELEAMKEPPADVRLFLTVHHLRNEGIADQIDKPYPYHAEPAMETYAARYNAAYARTPAVLRSYDSVLTAAAEHPDQIAALTRRAENLFYSNGHPNGAYMAREIVETFGVDSLMPGVMNPVAFLRTYASAERKRGNPSPFSPTSMAMLDRMEGEFVTHRPKR